MGHGACLISLADGRAEPSTISLVSAFLCGRKMKVKVGTTFSSLRHVKGGSPQGSILGNYLFCMTTKNLGGAGILRSLNSTSDSSQGEDLGPQTSTPARITRNRRRTHPHNHPPTFDPGDADEAVGGSDDDHHDPLHDEDSIRFFRFKNRMFFDTTSEIINETFLS